MNRDHFAEMEIVRRTYSATRRSAACRDFTEASEVAAANGFVLKQHADWHYSISQVGKKWLTNIYPGKMRLCADKNIAEKAPYVHLPPDWDLLDVVKGFIAAKGTS